MSHRYWPQFILLCLAEGLIALAATFLVPGGGLSIARLALGGLLAAMLAAELWLYMRARHADVRSRWLDASARPRLFRTAQLLASLLALTSGLLLFFLRYLNPQATASYYVRAAPFLFYLLLLSAQTVLWLAVLIYGIHPAALRERRGLLRPAAIFFGIFLLVWIFICVTKLGVTPDPSYWAEPGVPILGWQLLLALLVGLLFTLFAFRFSFSPRSEIILAALIWLLAFALWMSVPLTVLKNSSYAPIQPPLNGPFPASDATVYDSMAQSLLAGTGFLGSIPPRPLYILFLAALHVLFGQDYGRVILGQTLVFALLPVALYFLGKRLHSRAAGVTVALFAIFRELTSLWVSSETRVVNSKLLLSDFITTLALIAYLLLILRWLRDKRGSLFYAFLSGGALGLMLLLRSQSMFLAPGILVLALFVFWPDWKNWIFRSVIFALGMILAASPWLAHNYAVTGKITFDDPKQILLVASVYSGGAPSPNNPLFAGKSLSDASAYVMDTILHRPGYVAGFIANQFLANTIDSLLVLPIFARCDGLAAPVYIYWFDWAKYLSWPNILLLLVYLALIAFGLAAAWKRLRWLGLLPLVLFVMYTFSTSMARFSGWRYIFPADWVPYFYVGLGAAELWIDLAAFFGADASRLSRDPEAVSPLQPARPANVILAAAAFVFIGALPWVAERAIPDQLASLCPNLTCLAARGVDESQTAKFLSQPGALALTGRVLYPRYFSRNDGLASTNPSPAYAPRNFPRTGFFFLGDGQIQQVVLPMKGARPFPNAADAVVLGCQRDRYIEVRMLVFLDSGLTYNNDSLLETCQVSPAP